MIRLLIKHNACTPYLNQNNDEMANQASNSGGGAGDEVYDPFIKPKVA
jgi:hypothetical protein